MPVSMRYKNDEHEAVSSINLAFLKIVDKVDTKKEHVEFDHWAKRIMINQLIDEYRKDKNRRDNHMTVDPHTLPQFNQQSVSNNEVLQGDTELIMRTIQELKEPGKTIFNLHAIEGYSHDEIAKKLDMRIENCRYHLHSARKTLRTRLQFLVQKTKIS